MATSPSNPGAPPAPPAPASRSRLSKEERRELLARIERESSRTESPERVLQRAEQALQDGNRTLAERLVGQLEQTSPNLLGLGHLRQRLAAVGQREKTRANVRKAEEMLLRYIEQRKKTAAEFALEALKEIAPDHPRLAEYAIWVRDLDQEAAQQRQLDDELAAGRLALQVGDLDVARRHLGRLEALDAGASATAQLAAEITQAEAGEAESADIQGIKERFEAHVAALRLSDAAHELEELAQHAVPKVTLDRLGARLVEARRIERDQREMAAFEELFQGHVAAHRWQKARDVARQAGQRFRAHPRPAEMFNEVNLREAEDRRLESIRQGVAALEQFITEGKRGDAELALKLLKDKIEPQQLARFEARVREL